MAKVKAGVRHKKREHAVTRVRDAGVYHGKQAKTGNSLGLRFERALFHSHPEFNGEVEARVIGPGRMIVLADPGPKERTPKKIPYFPRS